ncbi:hypothetical protein BpHYR1_029509 [Brachionus plicatilis]|uniref:Uncharacterized protein n=1 Tax=Brachionus plicatilis TaxID=10195 RepID=A0A3M7RPB2_BRAPC|nr:hypothetical protein BpHYR1_029509 [Brachionus plicatilis]
MKDKKKASNLYCNFEIKTSALKATWNAKSRDLISRILSQSYSSIKLKLSIQNYEKHIEIINLNIYYYFIYLFFTELELLQKIKNIFSSMHSLFHLYQILD